MLHAHVLVEHDSGAGAHVPDEPIAAAGHFQGRE